MHSYEHAEACLKKWASNQIHACTAHAQCIAMRIRKINHKYTVQCRSNSPAMFIFPVPIKVPGNAELTSLHSIVNPFKAWFAVMLSVDDGHAEPA